MTPGMDFFLKINKRTCPFIREVRILGFSPCFIERLQNLSGGKIEMLFHKGFGPICGLFLPL